MISERHKTNNLLAILCCMLLWHVHHCCASPAAAAAADEVFEVLPQTMTATANVKTANRQDEVNVLAIVTPNATTTTTTTAAAARLDPNNNNEWRPLGHGDPLQKDPTYDYSPPALERVRYWAENNASSQETRQQLPGDALRNKTKSEILLLGVNNERDRLRTGQLKQSGAATSYASKTLHPSQSSYPSSHSSHYSSYPSQSSHYSSYPSHQSYSSGHPSPHPSSQPAAHSSSHSYAPQQSKYTGIRRSYYAPQPLQQAQHMPHTHLMPPPMVMKTQGLGMTQGQSQGNGMAQGQVQGLGMSMQQAQGQTQGLGMLMSPTHGQGQAHVEYRVMNSPSSNSYMSVNMGSSYSAPSMVSSPSSTPSKSYYSSPSSMATSSWYSSPPQRTNYNDPHHQESMQHYSFSRPQQIGSHSPNAIHAAPRKPWLHELLQKELVKPTMKQRMKPTMPATKYLMGTTKPQQLQLPSSTYAPLTYAPVTFVPGPPTIETPTTSSPQAELYITPSTTMLPTVTAGFRPIVMTTSTSTTVRPVMTTTTPASSRLMIPQTSNLLQRPTVAPAPELTTDALFSHYKQPPKPLLGPMYLIIEGHSKVKTYGQNELDPHSPKIVPVISKREPVVRIADPNEKRGTVETYQVKHLHTKTMPFTTTTTSATTTTTTTLKPKTNEQRPNSVTTLEKTATTLKPTTPPKTTPKSVATTAQPTPSSTSRPSLSLRTSPSPSPSSLPSLSPLINLLSNPSPPSSAIPPLNPSFSPRPSLTPSLKPTSRPNLPLSTTTTPPSSVHDLLSLLDNMFADAQEIAASSEATTKLKPVVTKSLAQQPEPRIGSQAGSIESELQEEQETGEKEQVKNGSESVIATSTEAEQPPRATRQVFDYDQLPESRIKLAAVDDELDYDDDDDDNEGEELEEAAAESELEGDELLGDGELDVSEDETSAGEHNLLKRIDKFVDDDVDDGDDDLEDLIEGLSPDDDDEEEDDEEAEDQQAAERQQQQHKR